MSEIDQIDFENFYEKEKRFKESKTKLAMYFKRSKPEFGNYLNTNKRRNIFLEVSNFFHLKSLLNSKNFRMKV
jgi:hypothetical protein